MVNMIPCALEVFSTSRVDDFTAVSRSRVPILGCACVHKSPHIMQTCVHNWCKREPCPHSRYARCTGETGGSGRLCNTCQSECKCRLLLAGSRAAVQSVTGDVGVAAEVGSGIARIGGNDNDHGDNRITDD